MPDADSAGFAAIWNAEWHSHVFAAALEQVKQQVSDRQFQIFDFYVLQNWPVREGTRMLRVSAAQVYLSKHRVGALFKKVLRRLEAE